MRKIKNKNRRLLKNLPLMLACAGLIGYHSTTFAELSNNRTTIDNGAIDVLYGGGNEENTEDYSDNRVIINDGAINMALGGESSSGEVSNNTIEINGGTIRFVNGGEIAYTYALDGGNALTSEEISSLGRGEVSHNTIEIRGGTINGRVIGGTALSGSAKNNSVEITGGTLNGDLTLPTAKAGGFWETEIPI